ncbi:S-adenosyl-L-methionine-dependent methyltransferase [Lophiostoma macrostomum CBS 122681]|uniref:DNA (cytosine-5-)-methyltransferase n=1 Tax=Lophiostoma macrostomum CBS 122681 TaxID=1314788 RepID=A0A6A6TA48_9PLEO|nr:S-adenosyl-L-methionine-dependent methyltransferase [Lophiostoma macrostomum CBS 122681]
MSLGNFSQPFLVDSDDEGEDDELIEILNGDDSDDSADLEEITPPPSLRGLGKSRRSPPIIKNRDVVLPEVSIASYCVQDGTLIQIKDTVELQDNAHQDDDGLHSGDFLRVTDIVINQETDEVKLRGYRLRLTKYLNGLLARKLNELVMVLHVTEGDRRDPFIQGQIEVAVNAVLRKRECLITSKPYNVVNCRHALDHSLFKALHKEELKRAIFHQGRLVCRWVNILVMQENGKNYNGTLRGIYRREVDDSSSTPQPTIATPSISRRGSSRGFIDDAEDNDDAIVWGDSSTKSNSTSPSKKRARSDSLEELGEFRRSRRTHRIPEPTKPATYTFGDCFCGAGGASTGASQAGLFRQWCLDFDQAAMQSYHQNHPRAEMFPMNAHDFPDSILSTRETINWSSLSPAVLKELNKLRVDILHLSPPCCYFSPVHTIPGQNDQANFEAMFTVGAIVKKIKPRVATLEQTYGLYSSKEHQKVFFCLMSDFNEAGYDVRYKIQDLAEFGLPQRRKRLLMIAARRGQPLPPFPKPTHGDASSGLKRFFSVYDALDPLRRMSPLAAPDPYHNPDDLKRIKKEPYEPRNKLLKGAITKNGGDSYHYSGTRKHTARELALFQSFPWDYQFCGPQTKAKEQIGNAFPPVMAAALYRSIAKTLEAYDRGFIEAEDDVCDVEQALALLDIEIPGSQDTPIDLMDPVKFPVPARFRYITRSPEASRATTPVKRRSVFGGGTDIEPEVARQPRKRVTSMADSRMGRRRSSSSSGGLEDLQLTTEERAWLAVENWGWGERE